MNAVKKIAVILMFSLMLPLGTLSAAEEQAVSDIRILIDVSGSMKKNDPDNLRSPALRMLAGVMPEQSKAGVWTFAKFVNMLVPWHSVDDSWRKQAESSSKQIHSYGLFTNIEQVLNKSTATALKADPTVRKSLILLSDGFVDLQAGDQATQASRQRIIDQIIPKLKKANITVHTIALSANADHELLKRLSFATDGWYQRADSNDDLQRIFLHMFEKAAQRDTLPLKDNQFTVDASVEEMTVLAFRSADEGNTRLILPDGSVLTPADASQAVRWLHEHSYDLITIDKPIAGNWLIDAELDPDNRVMVVTDMKLQTSDLPNNVLVGEKFDFEAMLTEKGEAITRSDFLDFVDANLQQYTGEDSFHYISIDRPANDHIFRAAISDLQPGTNDVVVTLKTATFQRERRQSINVVAMPFTIEQQQLEQSSRSHRITVQANTDLIQPDSVMITALLQAEDGSEWPYDMVKPADNLWQLTLADLAPQQIYNLSLQIKAITQKGRAVFLQPDVIELTDTSPPMEPVAEVEQPQMNEVVTEEPPMEDEEATATPPEVFDIEEEFLFEDEAPEGTATNMAFDSTLIIGNLVIAALLIMGMIWWRRQSRAMMQAGDLL